MGNSPSEASMGSRLKCIKCRKVLPPCTSFKRLKQGTVFGRRVHIFNGGEYYRPIGHSMAYECERCFNGAEMARRMGILDRRLEESARQAQEQAEEDEEQQEQQRQQQQEEQEQEEAQVTVGYLNEFESDPDDLLKILNIRCGTPISSLNLAHLSSEQVSTAVTTIEDTEVSGILGALDALLFQDWIEATPSEHTLQHTQVLLAELCAVSLDASKGDSGDDDAPKDGLANQVQSLLESVGLSARGKAENLLLCQGLYLGLMLLPSNSNADGNETDGLSDAALVAKRWADDDIDAESLLIVDVLSTLLSCLRSAGAKAKVPITHMEVRCLEMLMATLQGLAEEGEESHELPSHALLRLAGSGRWTPEEGLGLLKTLVEAHGEDDKAIAEALTLVFVHDLPSSWSDESGRPLAECVASLPEFRQLLRKRDASSLEAALTQWRAEPHPIPITDADVEIVRKITSDVLQDKNDDDTSPFSRDAFQAGGSLGLEEMQTCLAETCRAVHMTKGWYPTAGQMVSWCAIVSDVMRKQQQGAPQEGAEEPVVIEEDPCVVAMVAMTQACMGHKVNVVTSMGSQEEWADLFKYAGLSVATNQSDSSTLQVEAYQADVVYGGLEDFVADYFLVKADMGAASVLRRLFLVEERGVGVGGGSGSVSESGKPSKLVDDAALKFAAESLQKLMGRLETMDDVTSRRKFFTALCHMLLRNLREDPGLVLKSFSGSDQLSAAEVSILAFFEHLLMTTFAMEEEEEGGDNDAGSSSAGRACLEMLFDCAVHFLPSDDDQAEFFQRTLNLQRLTPIQALEHLAALTTGKLSRAHGMDVLRLMETYQVSAEWRDAKSGKPLPELLFGASGQGFVRDMEAAFKDEKIKTLDQLLAEIRQTKLADEATLGTVRQVVSTVRGWIDSGSMAQHANVRKARQLSNSTSAPDLAEVLAVLCNGIHQHVASRRWWPRETQMVAWCLLTLANQGKLLEMSTGEGKSVVIAMFAALRGLRGENVDVVSSSSVLCERDAEEFENFYEHFDLSVDANTNKEEDEHRKRCYQKNVVYGTIAAFAADHLRQTFEMKDVRPDRGYHCVVVDEVDSLLLDEGVQLTYLSSPMISMSHLNTLLAMIWSHVSQYGYLTAQQQSFVQGPPASFFKAIYDGIDTDDTEIEDALDVLGIAESCGIVAEGFSEDIYKSSKEEILAKVRTVSQEKVLEFFRQMEQYVAYDFVLYTLDADGMLSLQKASSHDPDTLELTFLVLDDGLCCPLYESSQMLVGPIVELIKDKVQYTPCENVAGKVSIPAFLQTLVEAKAPAWVENAFLAVTLSQGREYVLEDGSVCPVDYRSTGIVERNKRWGDGLQQFLEMKHHVKLSTISTVTNYLSNVAFFEKYEGKIYGTTGTLGTESDLLWLRDLYPSLTATDIPTFNRRKLFEVEGILKESAEEWKSEIKRVVLEQISPSNRGGRAALVICESINSAKEIHEELRSGVTGELVLYCRNDKNSLSTIQRKLQGGDVIVATNLAGRGTNIKVSDKVNENGGLFVVLTFLPTNNRVERQAFGRTARKGKPGSAQVVLNTSQLAETYGAVRSIEEAKSYRKKMAEDRLIEMKYDVDEMRLREDLFAQYCETLRSIYKETEGDEEGAVVAVMNEYWGIWLQAKSTDIDQLRRDALVKSLTADLAEARKQCMSQTSPCASIYHYIDFANVAMSEKKWDVALKLFQKAMEKDESWAAVAFYNHAYCLIKKQSSGYLNKALDDLKKAQASLAYLSEECMVCLQFIKLASSGGKSSGDQSELEKQFTTRCSMFSLFDKNISDAQKKIEEIKKAGRDAVAEKAPMFTLAAEGDEAMQEEACNLYSRGLKYIYTVEQEARFPWEAVLVFCLGVLQVVGGALLTAFTFGTLAQVGMGLIAEGVSDMITGVESMVTGKFSWTSWAIEKAISIGVSLISFGVGKLVTKGYKAFKIAKGAAKHLMAIPKALSTQVKGGLTAVMKTNLKNAVKHSAKALVENIAMYAIGKAETAILNQIIAEVKKRVKEGIEGDMKKRMEKEPLLSKVDDIILSHIVSKEQLAQILSDDHRKKKLVGVFANFANSALLPFQDDLSWQNKLNSTIATVLDSCKEDKGGKAAAVLTTIQTIHMSVLAGDALATVLGMSDKFFTSFNKELDEFKSEKRMAQDVSKRSLSSAELAKLAEIRKAVTAEMSTMLSASLVDVFQSKFSGHFISHAQGKANNLIQNKMRGGLKSDRTEDALKAGQKKSAEHFKNKQAKLANSHADKVLDPKTEGTIVDIKVLAETTNTKVVILSEGKNGKLSRLGVVPPNKKSSKKCVTLIYNAASGTYKARVNKKAVSGTSKTGEGTLFEAFARGMKPNATAQEVLKEAGRLRKSESQALRDGAARWEPLMRRQELVASTRGRKGAAEEEGAEGQKGAVATKDAIRQHSWALRQGGGGKPMRSREWMRK